MSEKAEWLDVVDEHDQVVGRQTRALVHQQGLRHRSTHIVLFNGRGQVLVQLRSRTKDTNPGLWDTSAAGHVDSGEDYLQCAAREVHEELGIELAADEFDRVGRLQPQQRNGYEFTEVFTVSSDQTVTLEPGEIEDARWVQPVQLEQWMGRQPQDFTDVFRIIWPMISSHRSLRAANGH